MIELEVTISSDLLRRVERLAELIQGDTGQEAISRMIAEAWSMRLHWIDISSDFAKEIDEPVAHFESTEGDPSSQRELTDWLFRDRR